MVEVRSLDAFCAIASQVRSSLNIPILGLFDADPYGLKILSVYMKGSKNMSYDSINLTTPGNSLPLASKLSEELKHRCLVKGRHLACDTPL